MSPEEIRTAVVAALTAVAPETDPAAIDPDQPLREQLDLDSMDFLNFVIRVHQRLGVEIPEADYPRFGTLAGAIAYLGEKTAAG
jgi:acyl carrier protein